MIAISLCSAESAHNLEASGFNSVTEFQSMDAIERKRNIDIFSFLYEIATVEGFLAGFCQCGSHSMIHIGDFSRFSP